MKRNCKFAQGVTNITPDFESNSLPPSVDEVVITFKLTSLAVDTRCTDKLAYRAPEQNFISNANSPDVVNS